MEAEVEHASTLRLTGIITFPDECFGVVLHHDFGQECIEGFPSLRREWRGSSSNVRNIAQNSDLDTLPNLILRRKQNELQIAFGCASVGVCDFCDCLSDCKFLGEQMDGESKISLKMFLGALILGTTLLWVIWLVVTH